MMIEEILKDMQENMEKSLEAMRKEMSSIRTGRASIAVLDGIKVDYFGSKLPLNQVATLSIPESRLIIINPWDKNVLLEIEKSIRKSDLGLNPTNDGQIIRLPIPPLTEERRRELIKMIKRKAEEYRVSIRNHRREAKELHEAMEEGGEITEDDLYKGQERIQKITDEYIKKVEGILEQKEKEILEI